jgi:hypothetical protein
LQSIYFSRGKITPLSRLKVTQGQGANGYAHQSQSRKAGGGRHLAYLPFLPLRQHDPQPGSRPVGTHRFGAGRQVGFWNLHCLAAAGVITTLDHYASLQFGQCLGGDFAFHLHQVGLRMVKARVDQAMRQHPVVGEQQQSFAVQV